MPLKIATAVVAAVPSYGFSPYWTFQQHDQHSDRLLPTRSGKPSEDRRLDFGDFAEDVPLECPATTTCPVICVANVSDCPTNCDAGLTLCKTGHCQPNCDDDNDDRSDNPCLCEQLNVACAKTVDLYPVCNERFQQFYDNNTECVDGQIDFVELISFAGPWFLVCYIGFGGLAILVVVWCFLNQKVFPVKSSTMPLKAAKAAKQELNEVWSQTGYKTTILGTTIYILVEFSFLAIQFLLLLTTLFYYMQQGAINWPPVFHDEVQVLKSFQIVWMSGFLWSFAFRYPSTGTKSLFLRRCDLSEATHVAVVAPIKLCHRNGNVQSFVGRAASMIWEPIDFVCRFYFSFPYDKPGTETIFCPIATDLPTGTRSVLHRMRHYVYDEEVKSFAPLALNVGRTVGDLLGQSNGLSQEEANRRRGTYGPNIIPLTKPTVLGSLYKELRKPFYLYQNFMVWTWANFFYYDMALVHTVVRLLGACFVAYYQHLSDCTAYGLSKVGGSATVLRGGGYADVPVEDVVPGDVVMLKPGVAFSDVVVLKSSRILVDESALTGESTPVFKVGVDPSLRYHNYSQMRHKSFTISAGTRVLEVDDINGALGIVMTTGSFTTKGRLLTDVFSYQSHNFEFMDEVKVVLFILAVEAIILLSLVLYFLNDKWVFAWFYGAFVIGTIFPPLLPTVFVVSIGISAKRLQSKRISCSRPGVVLLAGKVDFAFFDKTGTMTKHGLDFISFDASDSGDRIRIGMAVCHTLTITASGEIAGNQVDMASFKATGATLRHEKADMVRISFLGIDYAVLKHFEFDCHTATQSVIVEDSKGKRLIFVKGSPEAIKKLCMPTSLPDCYDADSRKVSMSGIYQIAMSYRSYNLEMDMADVSRQDVEGLLTFGGFINFRNVLRNETEIVLKEVKLGNVPTAMLTGDNVLTGICVAREAGMIQPNRRVLLGRINNGFNIEWVDVDQNTIVPLPSPHKLNQPDNDVDLAITGEAWISMCKADQSYVDTMLNHFRVFGRCKPEVKVAVVATFVKHGFITMMTGDGQNDCGCLKTAHVGVALSATEASLVAPFTSLDESLMSVAEILRQGRCALASTLAAYSYYIIYGQTETFIQVISAYLSISFSEWCWVFLDGVFSITLAFSLPLAKAASVLSARRPTASLLGLETLCSICGILFWNFLFTLAALYALFQQDWFQCRQWSSYDVSNPNAIGDNYESSVLFIVGGFQYVASAIVLNVGYSFRQKWYKNYTFVVLSSAWTMLFFVMTINPSRFSCIWRVNCDNEDVVRFTTNGKGYAINNPFNTTMMPAHFHWILVLITAANLATIMAWQSYFVHGYLSKRIEAREQREQRFAQK